MNYEKREVCGMMSDYELALWSLSHEERDMLKRYAQHYRQEYGDEHIHQERAEQSVNRKLEDITPYNPLPQIE